MEGELDDAADHLRREAAALEFRVERFDEGLEVASLVLFDATRRGHCMYVQSVRYPYVLVETSECDAKYRWSTVEANEPLIRFNGTKPWESGAAAQKGRHDAAAIPWAACDLDGGKAQVVREVGEPRVILPAEIALCVVEMKPVLSGGGRVATRSKERTESTHSPP